MEKQDKEFIEMALAEDIGPGDITTKALNLRGKKGRAIVVAKAAGIISGLSPFMETFRIISKKISFRIYKPDGSSVVPGDKIIEIIGPLEVILTGERTAMNIISQLSGVATMTRKLVDAISGMPVKILDTRKTMPGMRKWQKKAVRDGGAQNHRQGLYDMYLLKENHIAAAGGIELALEQAILHKKRTRAKIEVEVRSIDEYMRALKYRPDFILLDNFSLAMLRKSVAIARKSRSNVLLEASGNVNLKNIRRIANTGIDRISVGSITHSAPVLDLSLKMKEIV